MVDYILVKANFFIWVVVGEKKVFIGYLFWE